MLALNSVSRGYGGVCALDRGGGQVVDVETSSDNQRLMALAVGDAVSVECPPERIAIVLAP